jgi:hypothetical protein
LLQIVAVSGGISNSVGETIITLDTIPFEG